MQKVIRPFSPPIYLGKIEQQELDFIKSIVSSAQEKKLPPTAGLVGNIRNQFAIDFENYEQKGKFKSIFIPHLSYFASNCHILENTEMETSEFDFSDAIWVNFQHRGEFQPLHYHNGFPGQHVVILWIQVPTELIEENKILKEHSIKPCAGNISFINSAQETLYSGPEFDFLPEEGDVVVIPAEQRHLVYPFTSDATRISLSFNISSMTNRSPNR